VFARLSLHHLKLQDLKTTSPIIRLAGLGRDLQGTAVLRIRGIYEGLKYHGPTRISAFASSNSSFPSTFCSLVTDPSNKVARTNRARHSGISRLRFGRPSSTCVQARCFRQSIWRTACIRRDNLSPAGCSHFQLSCLNPSDDRHGKYAGSRLIVPIKGAVSVTDAGRTK
jgi:hypothetical protein